MLAFRYLDALECKDAGGRIRFGHFYISMLIKVALISLFLASQKRPPASYLDVASMRILVVISPLYSVVYASTGLVTPSSDCVLVYLYLIQDEIDFEK
jgi:hypothetical protein